MPGMPTGRVLALATGLAPPPEGAGRLLEGPDRRLVQSIQRRIDCCRVAKRLLRALREVKS